MITPTRAFFPRFILFLAAAFVLLLLAGLPAHGQGSGPGLETGPTPRGMMQLPSARLARPTLPPRPGQADLGAEVYFESCMTCHGDRGQGLTDDWKTVFDPQDRNCWQFRCHAQTHPVEGFELPKTAPAVVGPSVLAAFPTVLALHDFIQAKMPYQAPGTLSDTAYWQVTAYLLRANGVDLGNQPLDAPRAAALPLQAASPTPSAPALPADTGGAGPAAWVWLLILVAVLVGAILFNARARPAGPRDDNGGTNS